MERKKVLSFLRNLISECGFIEIVSWLVFGVILGYTLSYFCLEFTLLEYLERMIG